MAQTGRWLVLGAAALGTYLLSTLAGRRKIGPPVTVPGARRRTATMALAGGAKLLQDLTPVEQFQVYLVGFHPLRDDPSVQVEAHHYRIQVNEDLMQCVLFDGNMKRANLIGIEYIISERLFESLPEGEQANWHPHNYEILSGMLVAPGIPGVAEKALMKEKINSYGKTWHVWQTGTAGRAGDSLPLGSARLAWSFNRDGELDPGLLEHRDRRLGIDTGAKRRQRADLAALAHPQRGVGTLRDAFTEAGEAQPGVRTAR